MHVLSVSSLKGGVGKTTVTLGLASAAFAKGLRTLVVDLDPQADVSTGMDIDPGKYLNVADVLGSPKEKTVRAAIAPSGWTRNRPGTVDVMIGSPSAINFDGPHPSIRDIWKLEEALSTIEKDYELVETTGTQTWEEGCLSFPGVTEEIKRAERVKVKALDRNGQSFEIEADAFVSDAHPA